MAPNIKRDSLNLSETETDFNWSPSLLNHFKRGGKLWISRHGESLYNLYGRIGGNAILSERGMIYSSLLATYVNQLELMNLQVWTSEYIRTRQTSQLIHGSLSIHSELNEILSGDHDSLTYESIAEQFPKEFALRDQDKLRYRYPKGESYIDVCRRLSRLLIKISSQENILIISHQAVIRCILCAIQGTSLEDLPYIKVPLHTVFEIEFHSNGQHEITQTKLNVDCVNTHRVQPKNCQIDRRISDAISDVPFHI